VTDTPAPAPRRGQPPKLTAPRRTELLAALTGGATLAAAAAAAGVTPRTVRNARARDTTFDQDVAAALTGAKHRPEPAAGAGPPCSACTLPALALTPDGVTCTACGCRYTLTPQPVYALASLPITPRPLAHAS
jgi:hypothetical protein